MAWARIGQCVATPLMATIGTVTIIVRESTQLRLTCWVLVTINHQVTEEEVITEITKLNCDPNVHAILLQLPLDSENAIDADKCTNAIDINKVSLYASVRSI